MAGDSADHRVDDRGGLPARPALGHPATLEIQASSIVSVSCIYRLPREYDSDQIQVKSVVYDRHPLPQLEKRQQFSQLPAVTIPSIGDAVACACPSPRPFGASREFR